MISDFYRLLEKIRRLADLAQSLRRENSELRLQMSALTNENSDLADRIQEAHQRVAALLEKIPAVTSGEESA